MDQNSDTCSSAHFILIKFPRCVKKEAQCTYTGNYEIAEYEYEIAVLSTNRRKYILNSCQTTGSGKNLNMNVSISSGETFKNMTLSAMLHLA